MTQLFNPPTRKQLEIIAKGDQQLLLAFEALFEAVGQTLPNSNSAIAEQIAINTQDISNNGDEIAVIEAAVKTRVSNYHMVGNSTATVLNQNNPVKVLGATVSNVLTEQFNHTDNKAEYTGAETKTFIVRVNASTNIEAAIYIAKNGSLLAESISIGTQQNGMALVSLATNEYIETWVENKNNDTNIVVENLNVIIEGIV